MTSRSTVSHSTIRRSIIFLQTRAAALKKPKVAARDKELAKNVMVTKLMGCRRILAWGLAAPSVLVGTVLHADSVLFEEPLKKVLLAQWTVNPEDPHNRQYCHGSAQSSQSYAELHGA